jgi:hypothetical protein
VHSLPTVRNGLSIGYRNAFDMTGLVAVITGGASGIGFESAAALIDLVSADLDSMSPSRKFSTSIFSSRVDFDSKAFRLLRFEALDLLFHTELSKLRRPFSSRNCCWHATVDPLT